MTDWSPLTWGERVRIWLAGRIVTPTLWKRMCDLGYCPAGIHKRRSAAQRGEVQG